MNILFITANRLGDAVISTGLLNALITRYPTARVTVVCGPVAASLFEPCPHVERVIPLVKQRHDRHWLALWRACIGTRWDLAVDLRGSGVSLFLRAKRRRILRGGRRPGRRLGHIAGLFGIAPWPLPVTWSTVEQRRRAVELLPAGSRYLALAPTANWDGKIWPPESFAALAQDLTREGFVPVLFYGPGEDERRRAAQVIALLPLAHDLGGGRPVGEVAALLGRCALFVGNDSGLMHLAAASGIPTLGLFGPSKPSEYAPSGRCAAFVQAPGAEGEGAMVDISVAEVRDAALALLACQVSAGGG
ncbi:glycosyltransferase family 9 protein [Acidomonas methanolica]|uniref:Lipopolysaccharide heptosyl transferase/glycosyl transferase n=1 Tax=Acidomonas methanolica NBRC 104435 TaxID=1231351 RepID=A0A023D4D3_ACIMT|nr:glycosyltransferase family 9 protein [Acidomonas methanolica]MBU2653239.1 glycosyltransferase family 9 protein [Acidomonas methanolica]TCS32188.1 ADP-heptose:LPS heptosyltransferase [Acidomonas methanolica]GAJ28992.1 lipopolysaccharide heptosyl transferase/glycosyl transferase [Acidomonas methanolica NBRC 104435]GBQ52272.1 lipopolysaccharide heptosyltransferase [Acidomonas methanolica]GEK97622.1 glycosyl transferase [Acidomonas methanolica NBRC 104435]